MINSTENFGQSLERQHEMGIRRRLEEKLSLLQEFNDLLIESSGDCVLVVDAGQWSGGSPCSVAKGPECFSGLWSRKNGCVYEVHEVIGSNRDLEPD